MRKRYAVTLTDKERRSLWGLISSGKASARKPARARILLKAVSGAGQPGWDDCMEQNEELFAKFMNDKDSQRIVTEHLLRAVYAEIREESADEAV